MDCRTCQPTLLDLAYGELAPELAHVVRSHVDGCNSCNAALKALEQGIEGARQLAPLEPPPAMSAKIRAYAEQHARERAAAALAAKAAAKPRGGFVQSILDFIGRMASGRQFAMATIFALVVTVGVWVIPELQPLPEGQGVTVVSPDPEGEVAPSGGLAPAEPLDLTVDARSRRIRSREELEAAALAKSNAGQPTEELAALASESKQLQAVAAREERAAPPPAAPMVARAQVPSSAERAAPAPSAPAEAYASGEAERDAPSAAEAELKAFPESDIGEVAAVSPARSRSARPAATSKGAVIDDDAMIDPARVSGARSATPAPAAAGSDKRVSPLERARLARSTEGCAAALPAYEQAVQEYSRSAPQSTVLGAALIELSECQFQLGRETLARATLKRAAEVAPVSVRARALLDRATEARPAAKPSAAAPPQQ